MMKRYVALLMMLLLPFQMTLAAVVAIEMTAPAAAIALQVDDGACHHEIDTASGDTAPDTHVGHNQCGICHFSCCNALPMAIAMTPRLHAGEPPRFIADSTLPLPPATRPERPKWDRLA